MSNRGNNRGGRHLQKNIAKVNGNSPGRGSPTTSNKPQANNAKNAKQKWNTKKKIGVILGATVAVFALTIGILWFWVRDAREEVPDIRLDPTGPRAPVINLNPSTESNEPTESNEEVAAEPIDHSLRNTDKFTFLVLGLDPVGSNTDVIMVGTLDVENQTFDITNIPRDTIANVSWNLRKVNSIYANMRIRYRDDEESELRAMEATVEAFRDILGFKVDFWVVVNHRGLPMLVDAIGGVDFNVPVPMYHSGVTLPRGQRRLNGEQALHLLRFRGFASADIGRINTTQNFLTAAADQLIARRDSLSVADLANVFLNSVITDIPLSNLVWFGERFLELDAENIRFHTMPGQLDNIHGGSFVSILLDEWLELVNTYISPWDFEITPETVSILTRGPDRRLFVTDGNWQGNSQWGSGTLGANNPNNIAEWDTPGGGGTAGGGAGAAGGGGGGSGGGTGGGTANRPEQPPPSVLCPECNNPPEECTRCFVCGFHDCVCDVGSGSGGGADGGDEDTGAGGDSSGVGDGGGLGDGESDGAADGSEE